MSGYQTLVLPAAVACELVLMAFIFCIARFYEQKFRDSTYYASFLFPILIFLAGSAIALALGGGFGLAMLLTGACALLVLMTAGMFLYRKMTGVSR